MLNPKIYIFPFLLLFSLVFSSHFQGTQDMQTRLLTTKQLTPQISEINEKVDIEVRKQFWYYIRKSDTVYAAVIAADIQYLFFIVYQNYIGTFMAVASYNFQTKGTDVRTMIRLGEGRKDNRTKKIIVDPYFLEITVKNEKYLVEVNEKGQFLVNNQLLKKQELPTGNPLLEGVIFDEEVALVDQFLRTQYWYYIRGADIRKFQKVTMTTHNYILVTYNHKSGAYLGVANIDKETGQIKINTFVRLGSYQPPSLLPKQEGIALDSYGIVPLAF